MMQAQDCPPAIPKTVLYIGGLWVSQKPVDIRTVLGPCIAACLFDPGTGIGGMNHFMLPTGLRDSELPTRYGVHAMELLITKIMKLGGDRRRLRAKVFGGAHVLQLQNRSLMVPERNIQFIKEFLATEDIPIIGQYLGGDKPLLVHFFPHTGQALVKTLGRSHIGQIVQETQRYQAEVVKQITQPQQDQITLFARPTTPKVKNA